MKWFWWYFLIAAAIVVAGRVYLTNSFPYTHDGENHLARFANYKIALKEGQVPPRFAPNLQNHYGYPVFNYNYPLANILSLPFSFLKFNYEITFKLLALGALGLIAVGGSSWLAQLGISQKGQALGILALVSSPVVLNMTFYRGNIGELLSLGLIVSLLALIEKSRKQSIPSVWLTLNWLALLLAHNITAFFATGIVILYGAFRLRGIPSLKKVARTHLIAICLGITSSLWFWLPALLEKNLIVLDQAGSIKEYALHFVGLTQLLLSPLEFGFSFPGGVDTLSFSIGLSLFFTWVVITALLIRNLVLQRIQKTEWIVATPKWVVLLWLGSTSTLWLCTPYSSFIWQLFKPLQYAQFPWRFELFAIIGFMPLFAWLITNNRTTKAVKLLLFSGLIIQLWQSSRIAPADYFHRTIVDYDAFSQTTSTQNENRTKAFNYTNISDWQPTAAILSGEGKLAIERWNGTSRRYTVDANSPVTVVEPTMVFAGWQTHVDGKPVSYIDSEKIQGRLAYELPAGTHQITSRFTQKTPARIIGNTCSFFALVIILIQLLRVSTAWLRQKNIS